MHGHVLQACIHVPSSPSVSVILDELALLVVSNAGKPRALLPEE